MQATGRGQRVEGRRIEVVERVCLRSIFCIFLAKKKGGLRLGDLQKKVVEVRREEEMGPRREFHQGEKIQGT